MYCVHTAQIVLYALLNAILHKPMVNTSSCNSMPFLEEKALVKLIPISMAMSREFEFIAGIRNVTVCKSRCVWLNMV